ncbi:DUF4145 domain-containing protein [Saccharophagus degradans]|uniref:DUF4145 domain-containing protein n=1 Tax=Saccharophagus degradans TaxID=86304 RepID=UPI001C08B3D8|nr:DUF4145 domain-containing protein [Saccharophagus degradans]MBU2987344.1 DUF4145 domain-containing protein [Saccharophagus degradans]
MKEESVDILHVETVKEAIGSQAVEALRKIFESRKGEPPSVPIQRFRADHEEWIEVLDILEGTYSLIERSSEYTDYLIRPYALPLIGTSEADEILNLMDKIYERFPEIYKQHLSQPMDVNTLCGSVSGSNNLINESLYYISESHGTYSGKTTGFPYKKNSTLCISESVLAKKSIGKVLSEYYEWHFVNPKSQVATLESFDYSTSENRSIFFREKASAGKPDWYEFLGDTQKALILEIDCALSNRLEALPTIGLRTLLETIMVDKVGDIGNFAKKVKRFTEEGYVTPKMSEALSHVLDAGNASAHRAYFPSRDDLMTCVELVKHLMHGIYILTPRVENVADNTPKRGE